MEEAGRSGMDGHRVEVEGMVNLRDLGGWPVAGGGRVREGAVYRGDAPSELTPRGLDALAGLGLWGICDLRVPAERERRPSRLPAGHRIRIEEPGFLPEGGEAMLRAVAAGRMTPEEVLAEVECHYALLATRHLDRYAPMFEFLLEAAGRPVLIHCTSGKDRTGFGAALILLALGCDEEAAMRDYARSDAARRDLRFMFRGPVDPRVLGALASAPGSHIRAGLAALRQAHGAEGWPKVVGLGPAERAALKRTLVVPS